MFDYQYLIVSGSSLILIIVGMCMKYKFNHCKFGNCCSIDNNDADLTNHSNNIEPIVLDLPGISGNLNKV